MPNVKIYVDEQHYPTVSERLEAALPKLRALLCEGLAVDAAACQIAVLPVLGLKDQAQVNAELSILPRPERTPDKIRSVAGGVREHFAEATGLHVAVRVSMLDASTYVALK